MKEITEQEGYRTLKALADEKHNQLKGEIASMKAKRTELVGELDIRIAAKESEMEMIDATLAKMVKDLVASGKKIIADALTPTVDAPRCPNIGDSVGTSQGRAEVIAITPATVSTIVGEHRNRGHPITDRVMKWIEDKLETQNFILLEYISTGASTNNGIAYRAMCRLIIANPHKYFYVRLAEPIKGQGKIARKGIYRGDCRETHQ